MISCPFTFCPICGSELDYFENSKIRFAEHCCPSSHFLCYDNHFIFLAENLEDGKCYELEYSTKSNRVTVAIWPTPTKDYQHKVINFHPPYPKTEKEIIDLVKKIFLL
jgi:hypothetical protein